MGIAALPSTTNGISTVQDLYDLINGKTTTTSGGDVTTSGVNSTVTTNEGISQDSMDAMLKSALEGSQGLASVAQGQRTAGGYNSTTNRLLVNDLMTRTASQIAQQNKSKVVQTVSAPTTQSIGDKTQVAGGISTGGLAKSAGVIGLGQVLSGGGLTDLTGALKNFGISFGGTTQTASNPVVSPIALGPSGNENMSQADQYASYGAGQTTPTASMTDQYEQIPTEAIQEAPAPAPAQEAPSPDIGTKEDDGLAEFADGGLVSRYADGGKITKKGSATLSTNQFARVIDPRTGLIGSGTGANEDQVAQGPQAGAGTATPTTVGTQANSLGSDFGIGSPQGTTTLSDSGSGGSGGDSSSGVSRGDISNVSRLTTAVGNIAQNPGLAKLGVLGSLLSSNAVNNLGGITERAMSGETTRADVGDVSKIVGSVGTLAGNPALKNVADVGSIASSSSIGEAAAKIGDKLTGGVVSKIKNLGEAVMSGDMQTGVNALASMNPLGIGVNAALSLGDTSLGKVATVGYANLKPGDSLENYLQARNYIGTAVGDNSEVQKADAAAKVQTAQDAQDAADAQAASDQAAAMAATAQSSGVSAQATNTGTPATIATSGSTSAPNGGGSKGFIGTGEVGTKDSAGLGTMGGGGYGTESDGGGTSSMANGGEVAGTGGPIDDKIHAMLSDGEYVLSADTVKAIGIDKLDALQEKYHTPAATQRLLAFGKR